MRERSGLSQLFTLTRKRKLIKELVTRIKKGDTVEIIGNIPFKLKNKSRPLLGKVTHVDGSYIDVRPKYQRFICEFYPSELKISENKKH